MSKKTQYQGLCVVCNGKGLSDEHVWSDWLDSILPRGNSKHSAASSLKVIDQVHRGRPIYKPEERLTKVRQGAVHAVKTRRVCIGCNGGWMSGIVDRAKEVATQAILLRPGQLSPDGQTKLATWLALSAAMRDQSARIKMPKMRHKVLLSLWKDKRPPDDFFVAIGALHGGRSVNDSYNARLARTMLPPHEISAMVHSVAVSMGGLYAVMIAPWKSDPAFLRSLPGLYADCLVQIWPPRGRSIPWPNYAGRVLRGPFVEGNPAQEVANRARDAFSDFCRDRQAT